jgi:hypothetical protein
MGRCIVHHEGRYLEWSTVVDAPVSETMREAEMREWLLRRHGESVRDILDERFERAKTYGTSYHTPTDLRELLECNRAGENEACLSYEEFMAEYFP